jgi:hypothetical protein
LNQERGSGLAGRLLKWPGEFLAFARKLEFVAAPLWSGFCIRATRTSSPALTFPFSPFPAHRPLFPALQSPPENAQKMENIQFSRNSPISTWTLRKEMPHLSVRLRKKIEQTRTIGL